MRSGTMGIVSSKIIANSIGITAIVEKSEKMRLKNFQNSDCKMLPPSNDPIPIVNVTANESPSIAFFFRKA